MAFWKSGKNRQDNNKTKSKMKHNKTENKGSLITRFFRLHKKLDFNGSTFIKKIKNYIIRTFLKIRIL